MFKIAHCAGHYIGTSGKRLPATLDKNQTREWTLNDRVADYFAKAAAEYEGVELLRTDDPTGKTFIDIPERVAKANAWGANLYVDMHHDAAGKIFNGGGVTAYCYPGSSEGRKYQIAIYEAVIAAGGIKGNRAYPLQEKKFDTLALTNMPAVLMEYGFMDSTVDAPIILTDAYAKKVAYGTMAGIAKAAGLKKKLVVKPATAVLEVHILQIGCEGEDVRALQFLLNGRKCPCGDADGIYGSKTKAAVSKFQREHGLKETGVADVITLSHLMGLQ